MQDDHPIAYESRSLKSVELNFSTYEKELLSVIHALKLWKHYLLGVEFLVKTDHQSLRYLLNQPSISERHIKWATFLQNFQETIEFFSCFL